MGFTGVAGVCWPRTTSPSSAGGPRLVFGRPRGGHLESSGSTLLGDLKGALVIFQETLGS